MHPLMARAGAGLLDIFRIWELGRFCARHGGATPVVGASGNRSGSERAAEDPLGARE
jgi:hypothetical protein